MISRACFGVYSLSDGHGVGKSRSIIATGRLWDIWTVQRKENRERLGAAVLIEEELLPVSCYHNGKRSSQIHSVQIRGSCRGLVQLKPQLQNKDTDSPGEVLGLKVQSRSKAGPGSLVPQPSISWHSCLASFDLVWEPPMLPEVVAQGVQLKGGWSQATASRVHPSLRLQTCLSSPSCCDPPWAVPGPDCYFPLFPK